MTDINLLLEAERRGLLDDDNKALLDEARRRGIVAQNEEGAATRFMRNVADTIPFSKEIKAGAATAAEMLTGGRDSVGDTYYRNLRRERELGQQARQNYGADNIAAETIGYVAQAPITLGSQAMRGAQTTTELLKEAARQGGLWGTVGAVSNLDTDKTTSPVEATKEILTGTAGGAALGVGLAGVPMAFGAGMDMARNALLQRQNNRVDIAQTRLQDFVDAGVPTYAPALETKPNMVRTAQSVQDSVAGGRLRRQAQDAEAGMDAALARELDYYGGRASAVDAGQRTQDFLRRNVVDRSIPSEALDDMSLEELRRVADIAPARDLPPRPIAPRVPPKYPPDPAPQPVQPDDIDAFIRDRNRRAGITNAPEPTAVERDEARRRLEDRSVAQARRLRERARSEADAAASDRTLDRQFILDDLYQKKAETAPAQQAGITLGNVRESSYPTELDAGYTYARKAADFKNAPEASAKVPVYRSFLERAGHKYDPGRTRTYQAIEDIAQNAKRQGLLPGYKSLEETPEMLFNYLARNTSGDVVQSLREQLKRADRDGGLGLKALAENRTRLRYVLDLPRAIDPNARDIDSSIGENIYRAMTEDLARFYERAGRLEARDMIQSTNRAYRDFKQNIEEPLTKVFSEKTDPAKAIRTLVADTQPNGDIRRLNAFFRVVRQKGDAGRGQEQATAALLGQMAEGGIDEFVKNYRAMTPEALRLMFPGDQNEMRRAYEALIRVHTHMQPFRGAQARGNDLAKAAGNTINQVVGGSLAFGQIQAALTAYGGAYLLGRYMASPRYVRALTTYMRVSQRNPNQALRQFQQRIGALAAGDEVGGEIAAAIGVEPAEQKAGTATGQKRQPLEVVVGPQREASRSPLIELYPSTAERMTR